MPLDQPKTWAEALAGAPNPFEIAIGRYARAPIAFVREILGAEPDPWQIRALRALAQGHTRVAIRSGHGVGKSCLAAWVVTWFSNTRAPFKCALTAPSAPQLYDVLVPETHKWFDRLPQSWRSLWDITSDHIKLRRDPECFVTARTSRPDQPEAMAGLHSDHILLVADEASGIPEPVYEAAGGSMSSAGAITLLIGNPTRSTGFFWRVCTLERERWFTMQVSSADSPRVARSYIDEMAQRYGTHSNAYRIRVTGEFPTTDDDTFIPTDIVDDAMVRDVPLDPTMPELWGVDCARFGDDESVLIKRKGAIVTEMPRAWRQLDTMQLAGAVKAEFDHCLSGKPNLICIDAIGIGAGVADRLAEQGLPVLAVNVSEQPSVVKEYTRLRDELWARGREWLASRSVRLPKHERLRDDLCAPKYSFGPNGKLQIESKALMKSRGLPSCDYADALLLTFADQTLGVASQEHSGLFSAEPVLPPMRMFE
jgi:phage terminase large subunit